MLIRLDGFLEAGPEYFIDIGMNVCVTWLSISLLGSYIPWDVKMQVGKIRSELGWQGDVVENVPSDFNYEKN